MERESLRELFDQDAQRYERARPGYPVALMDDLAFLAGIQRGSRVVEIGPGTGQATTALAASGAHVVAVELGAELAKLLQRKLSSSGLEVIVSSFEDWSVPPEPFDAICAFTAWHWLDPAIRTQKAAALLHPGGALATVTTAHVAGGTEAFFADVQSCYERWDPSTPPGLRLPAADAVAADVDEVDASPLFLAPMRRRYQQDITYTTSSYLDVLSTYSGHRALEPKRRQALLRCIADLIDRRYGGTVVKRYLYELRIARKRTS